MADRLCLNGRWKVAALASERACKEVEEEKGRNKERERERKADCCARGAQLARLARVESVALEALEIAPSGNEIAFCSA